MGQNYNGPMRFAHRGLVQAAPENTLEAFQAAIDSGFEGIELDIRLSKDGEVFVVHDRDLSRMTDGKITDKVCELTTEELRNVVLPYAAHLLPKDPPVPYSESLGSVAHYSDEQIEELRRTDERTAKLVTFEEFDRWFENIESNVTIEIEFCDPGLMPRMYEILSGSKNCSKYILFSGSKVINEEIRDVLAEKGRPDGLRLGANVVKLDEETIEFIDSCDFFEVGLNDFKFDAEDVKRLNNKGIEVFSNLGDYPEWWEQICTNGVLGFKTNYAEAFTKWYFGKGNR